MGYNPLSAARLHPDDPFFRADMGKGLAKPEASQSYSPHETHGFDNLGGYALNTAGAFASSQGQWADIGKYAPKTCPINWETSPKVQPYIKFARDNDGMFRKLPPNIRRPTLGPGKSANCIGSIPTNIRRSAGLGPQSVATWRWRPRTNVQ